MIVLSPALWSLAIVAAGVGLIFAQWGGDETPVPAEDHGASPPAPDPAMDGVPHGWTGRGDARPWWRRRDLIDRLRERVVSDGDLVDRLADDVIASEFFDINPLIIASCVDADPPPMVVPISPGVVQVK
jgi:hypothetical protein